MVRKANVEKKLIISDWDLQRDVIDQKFCNQGITE